jgi:NAD(P) transhydrogenase subunit alpha
MIPLLAALDFDAVGGLVIFVLAAFVGVEVITKVPAALHTPLMSGSNAISGIILVGAILVTSIATHWFVVVLGLIGVVLASINVVGGFVVTDRMLRMFGGNKARGRKDGGGRS